jgi:hypothetical protein
MARGRPKRGTPGSRKARSNRWSLRKNPKCPAATPKHAAKTDSMFDGRVPVVRIGNPFTL